MACGCGGKCGGGCSNCSGGSGGELALLSSDNIGWSGSPSSEFGFSGGGGGGVDGGGLGFVSPGVGQGGRDWGDGGMGFEQPGVGGGADWAVRDVHGDIFTQPYRQRAVLVNGEISGDIDDNMRAALGEVVRSVARRMGMNVSMGRALSAVDDVYRLASGRDENKLRVRKCGGRRGSSIYAESAIAYLSRWIEEDYGGSFIRMGGDSQLSLGVRDLLGPRDMAAGMRGPGDSPPWNLPLNGTTGPDDLGCERVELNAARRRHICINSTCLGSVGRDNDTGLPSIGMGCALKIVGNKFFCTCVRKVQGPEPEPNPEEVPDEVPDRDPVPVDPPRIVPEPAPTTPPLPVPPLVPPIWEWIWKKLRDIRWPEPDLGDVRDSWAVATAVLVISVAVLSLLVLV